MKRIILAIVFLMLISVPLQARAKYAGVAQKGGKTVRTSTTTTYELMETFPNCLITVYLTGTLTLATIYSDSAGTAKANPFNSNSVDASFSFYADAGRYDIKFSGLGIVTPFTLADISIQDFMESITPSAFGGCLGVNDTAVFSSMLLAAGAIETTIELTRNNGVRCAINSMTIPANITIDNSKGIGLKINNLQTLTHLGSIVNAPGKPLFHNVSATGQGIVLFSGNKRLKEVQTSWFGVVADAAASGTLVAPGTITGTDNTFALQAALNSVAIDCFATVMLGTGRHLFSSPQTIIIPPNVTLQGTLKTATSLGTQNSSPINDMSGCALWVTSNAGVGATTFSSVNLNAPYFLHLSGTPLKGNSVLRGVSIYYPNQLMTAATPTSYPFSIGMRGPNSTVENVQLVNSYAGIDCSYTDRPTINNVVGQILFRGLFADHIRDVARFQNIHWNPYWSFANTIYTWQSNFSQGFVWGKAEWIEAVDCFTYGNLIGFWLLETGGDVVNGQTYPPGGPAGNYKGMEVDNALWPIYIQGNIQNPDNRFSDGSFRAYLDADVPSGLNRVGDGDAGKGSVVPIAVRIRPGVQAVLQFVNCIFEGVPQHAIEIDTPTALTLLVSNSNFGTWISGQPAVLITAPAAGAFHPITFIGNNFRADEPQITATGRIGLSVIGNQFNGAKRINAPLTNSYVDIGNNTPSNGMTITFTNLDTTPAVNAGYQFRTANTGATLITNLDSGQEGQEVTILCGDANTTFQDNADIELNGGANFVCTAKDVLVLKKFGTTWYETSRSIN